MLWLLRQRRPPGLDPAQKAARALQLEELGRYAARGVFPRNTHFPGERRPVFIDGEGTRCAVAHLLDLSGEEELALAVRDRMNFAPVSDIVEEPRFVAWLEAAGFTREEIALVQPAYCSDTPSDCVCGGALGDANLSLVTYYASSTGAFVTAVHRGVPGIEVGTRVVGLDGPDGGPTATGDNERLGWLYRPLKDVDGGTYAGVVPIAPFVVEDGGVQCSTLGARSLPMSKSRAVEALLSPSREACEAYLTAIDDRWDDDSCGFGCDMTNLAGSSAQSLAVLSAIVGAIAARRRK